MSALPSGVMERIVATVSTWPWTKWPPIRVVAETARSRFTLEFSFRLPRFVRRRVSGETPTLKVVGVKEVIVRHVPGRESAVVLWVGLARNKGVRRQERVEEGTVDAYAVA